MVNPTRGAWWRGMAGLLAGAVCVFVAAGCGGGDDDDAVAKPSAPAPVPGGGGGAPPPPPPPAGAPAVFTVSPGAGPAAGGYPVQIGGANFAAGATVLLGGTPAVVTFSSATTLNVLAPSAPPGVAGALSVTVTHLNGAVGALGSAFTFVAAPVLSSTGAISAVDFDVDETGVAHVVWQAVLANGDVETRYARSTDNGLSWTGVALLQRTSNAASRPRIGAGGGSVLAVWNESVGTTEQISGARSTDAGVSWSGASAYQTTGSQRPDADVGVDDNGNATVIHLVGGGTTVPTGSVQVHVRTSTGPVGSAPGTPVTVASGTIAASAPAVAADANGVVVVTWLAAPAGGGTRELFVTSSTDGAATFITPLRLTQAGTTGRVPGAPSLALRGGRAVIAFVQDGFDQANQPVTDVLAAISADAGANWPGGGVLAGGVAGLQRYTPVAAASANGDVNVAWQESIFAGGGGGSGFEIRSARTADAGGQWSIVNRSGTAGSSILPAIAGGTGNRVIHLWVERAGSASTIYSY